MAEKRTLPSFVDSSYNNCVSSEFATHSNALKFRNGDIIT